MNWVGEMVQERISKNDTVLDLGCGIMLDIMDFHPAYPSTKLECKELVGVDLYQPYLDYLSERDVETVRWDLTELPLPFTDKSFDVVLLLDMLEHLPTLEAAKNLVREAERIARKKVFLITPKKYDPDTFDPWQAEPDNPYYPFGKTNQLQKHNFCIPRKWIENQGFSIVRIPSRKAEAEEWFAEKYLVRSFMRKPIVPVIRWKKYFRWLKPVYRRFFPQKFDPYPEENYTNFLTYWDDKRFPRFADVETTNLCNAKCLPCLHHTMTKPQGIMSLEEFKWIAKKLKVRGVCIRGFYTVGEPLLDPTLFEKYAYAKQLGILIPEATLSTNVSLLTPEKYQGILANTDNISLSFFNVGAEFERLTGNCLLWDQTYKKAIDFIKYRDHHQPDYKIRISCNICKGSDLQAVKKAFEGYRVEFAVDAGLEDTGRLLRGYIKRTIMNPKHRCDGHLGVLQIKWNGNCELCSFDFYESTLFANIFKDSWAEIERKFKEGWKKPFSLCARCDYWHLYWKLKKNGFRHIDMRSWLKAFLKEGWAKPVLDQNEHDVDNKYWTAYHGGTTERLSRLHHKHQIVAELVEEQLKNTRVLDLGCGFGRMNLFFDIKEYYGYDPCKRMIQNAKRLNKDRTNAHFDLGDGRTLPYPTNFFDIVVCSTVMLHLKVKTVEKYTKEVFRVLKPEGFLIANFPKNRNLNVHETFSNFEIEKLRDWFANDVFKFSKRRR